MPGVVGCDLELVVDLDCLLQVDAGDCVEPIQAS